MKPTDKPIHQDIVVKTIDGNTDVRIPVNTSWGTDKKLMPIVAAIYEVLPLLGQYIANLMEKDENKKKDIDYKEFADSIPNMLRLVPDQLSQIVAVLTSNEVTWIEDNLTTEGLIRLVAPFLSRVVGRFSNLQQHAKKIQAQEKKKN